MNNTGIFSKMRGSKIFANPFTFFILFLAVIFFNACKEEYPITPFYEGIFKGKNESMTEFVIAKADTFSDFREIMKVGKLDKTLTAYNPHGNGYTLFLPTNEAFDKFISKPNSRYNSFQELLKDTSYVKELVRYHVANIAIRSNDFPFGALSDTCLSGDFLSINFRVAEDSVVPVINNVASIVAADIELNNGFVHIIDEILEPIIFNNYEWLKQNDMYSIFTMALEITGINDTFTTRSNESMLIYPASSLLVETDEVFNISGIFSIDDLIARYSPDNQDYSSSSNLLYQFVAYHILEGKVFLNNMEGNNNNYNTFSNLPVSIDATGLEIMINSGVEIFDTLVADGDTSVIDFVTINYDLSNIITKNGGIHAIRNVMKPFRPLPRAYYFQFYEDPMILGASKRPNYYRFEEPEEFEKINWNGVKYIEYVKSSTYSGFLSDDYLVIDGEFSFSCELPKILPGTYVLLLQTNGNYSNNAFIQVFLDDKRLGANIDLTSGNYIHDFIVSTVNFIYYEKHRLTIKTLIPGRMTLDCVIFVPGSQIGKWTRPG